MFKKIIRKMLIAEKKNYDDIELYILDRRADLNLSVDMFRIHFRNDNCERYMADARRIGAIADDIDEYLVDLRNSAKRINAYRKLLGLKKMKEA